MATITQIAKEANVSTTLVSRVLNNKPGVSSKNRANIQSVIKKHNYVPNAIARSLVTQKTATIGVVMETLTSSFFFDFIDGIQNKADELEYNVVFSNGKNNLDLVLNQLEYFSQGRVDGIIAHYSRTDTQLFEQIKKASNFVIVEGIAPGKVFNSVQVNNFEGAYRATEHLIKLGYKNIVHFTGDLDFSCAVERMDGFSKAMHDHALPTDNAIVYTDYLEDLAYEKMKDLIALNKIPDACFTGADKTAFGILRAMYEHNLSAPKDMALIGFDGDLPDTRSMVFPKLTTMRQPFYELGQEAVRLLVHAIKNPTALPITTVLNAELVIGDTCR